MELKPCPFCKSKPYSLCESHAECTDKDCPIYGIAITVGIWNYRPTPEVDRLVEAVEDLLGMDQPYNLKDTLDTLCRAVDHLLVDHACDQQGYEQWREARNKGARYWVMAEYAIKSLAAYRKEHPHA